MSKIFKISKYNSNIDNFITPPLNKDFIYQSEGLSIHIEKRHHESVQYIEKIPEIINSPDYIGINPTEKGTSFELVKIFDDNIQIGIKLDTKNDYLYVATLHSITESKLKLRIKNGRLKPFT